MAKNAWETHEKEMCEVMKKGKFKNGDIIEIYKPFLMLIEFMTAFACMYICMVDDSIYFGIAAIFMGWQAGWGNEVHEIY